MFSVLLYEIFFFLRYDASKIGLDFLDTLFCIIVIFDVIKQNESELANTVFKIQPKFLLFPIVCSILQLFVSLEPIAQSLSDFHQIKA